MSFGHAVVELASYWQLYLWTGCKRGLAMGRAGKRHLLRGVWFEEWMRALRCRICSASDDIMHECHARHRALHVLGHH